MPAPFQHHIGVSRVQSQEAGLFTKTMQGFVLLHGESSLTLLDQQTAIQALASGWQLAASGLPQGVVIQTLQGS